MFKYIKNKLFGSKIFQRTASVTINSKYKIQQKRPLSIDSKQKKMQEKLRQQHECPQVIQIEQHIQNYQCTPHSNLNDHFRQDMDCLMVSQSASFDNDHLHLTVNQQPNLLQGLSSSLDEPRQVQPATNPKRKQLFPNYIQEGMMHQTITRNGKILIKRSPEKKVIKKIQQQCSLCKKTLNYSDSIQLACTHRCHKTCSVKMQWRMKYTCDLCQSRNEKKHLKSHK